ncbi:MAG: exodeoxyribonuclease VII small subunit [Planctomycetota bacterium]|nr:exodeoxyribonuclease VII small subunit [Planctomycetota bacterium]
MAPKDEPRSDAVGFEAHLEALEEAVRALESAELTLEDSLSRYQDGVAHLRACRGLLDEAEARLAELVADADGQLEERPLRVTEQGLEDDPER